MTCAEQQPWQDGCSGWDCQSGTAGLCPSGHVGVWGKKKKNSNLAHFTDYSEPESPGVSVKFWDGNHLLTARVQVKASTAGSGCATAPHPCHRDTVTACHSPVVVPCMGLCEDPAQPRQKSSPSSAALAPAWKHHQSSLGMKYSGYLIT